MGNKVLYEKLEGFEFKDKTAITSAEIVAYLKSTLLENSLFTFGQEAQRRGKALSKLHRYLIGNLASYQASCASSVSNFEEVTDLEEAKNSELVAKSDCLSGWIDV